MSTHSIEDINLDNINLGTPYTIQGWCLFFKNKFRWWCLNYPNTKSPKLKMV